MKKKNDVTCLLGDDKIDAWRDGKRYGYWWVRPQVSAMTRRLGAGATKKRGSTTASNDRWIVGWTGCLSITPKSKVWAIALYRPPQCHRDYDSERCPSQHTACSNGVIIITTKKGQSGRVKVDTARSLISRGQRQTIALVIEVWREESSGQRFG